ncbi:MAG: hypothetical protein H8D67_05505 [Deltaproteobacteria bacterium]|nr:hypothetical protein [Deltaproteobacteria bacterium]
MKFSVLRIGYWGLDIRYWVLGIEDFEFEIPYGIEIYGKMDRFRAYL